jgi:uncharacterized protein (TIGR03435 family)
MASAIVAQNSQGDHSVKNRSSGGATTVFRFEVLSIKPIQRGPGTQIGIGAPTQNGFTATTFLNQLVAFAYGPPAPFFGPDRTEIRNLPNWTDLYLIDARVSQVDLKAWQSQGKNRDLLRAALRTALQERFKLTLHQEPAQRPFYALVVSKRGPRLKPADPGAKLPVGVKLPSGGVETGIGPRGMGGSDFHGATMEDLINLLNTLSNQFDGPVRDRTGLTGRYDFQVPRIETPDENRGYTYSVSNLGLELKRSTENRPILVIDHVERPTPN